MVDAALLQYARADVLGGQLWRLLTGSLVHVSAAHAVMDVAALAGLLLLARYMQLTARAVALLPVLCVGANAGLLLWPDLAWCRGLSGANYALLAWLAAQMLRTPARAWGAGSLLLAAAKVAWDAQSGAGAMAQLIGAPVLWHAHAAGLAWGLVCAARRLPTRDNRLSTHGASP